MDAQNKKNVILLVIVAIILAAPMIIYSGLGEDQGYFGGTDDMPGEHIEGLDYDPWFEPLWEPPSGEVESLLFALQAAIGGLILGYFIGNWSGRAKCKDDEEEK